MEKADALLIRCPNCGAKNRVEQPRLAQAPVCGRCKTPLLADGKPLIVTDTTLSNLF
ncbi:MAG TPA: hypothetical protein PLD20_17255 [Blastocatellia bacterium]|nr:hypothetical protein [Blastocatellia bacterium]HMZ19687.1 hypothetical protein [Blastocatellia bacterium]